MKILLCTSTFETITHGPAKFANLMLRVNEMEEGAHELRILTPDVFRAVPGRIYKINRYFPPFPFGAFWMYTDNFFYQKALLQIRAEFDFDVVLFNNAIQAWKTAKDKKRSFYVAGMINDDEHLLKSLSGISFSKKWWIDIFRKPLELKACRAVDLVITNSDYLKKAVIDHYRLPEAKVFRLYKSIDLAAIEFVPDRGINLEDRVSILFVKSDFKRGGLLQLVKALEKIKRYQFRVVVMGPTEGQRAAIEKYFLKVKNVMLDFRGPTGQGAVFSAMKEAAVFCVPALREALGVANIEALAAGVPVVSTEVGGIPEVLGHGKYGWLAKKNDVDDLSQTIEACLLETESRWQKSRAGRKQVAQNFHYKDMLSSIIEKFKKIPSTS